MIDRPAVPRARSVVSTLILALAALADPARAAEELHLTWLECPAGGGIETVTSSCNSNLGSHDLYAAFRMPFASDSVIGLELVVDVQHAQSALPDWWRFDPLRCREGQLVADFDFAANPFCVDWWVDTPAGGLIDYVVGQPRGMPSQARIRVAGSLLSDNFRRLEPTELYYGARIRILNGRTAPPQTVCPGCAHAACLVLNSIILRRRPDAPGGDVVLTTPGPANGNLAKWQGSEADCFAVPVRATTWGRVKGLYR